MSTNSGASRRLNLSITTCVSGASAANLVNSPKKFEALSRRDGMIWAERWGPIMDHSHAEMKLPWLSAQIRRQVQGRRLKVYVERLDTNFNLTNLGGKRLSLALKFSLSQRGIIMGWKKGAEVWPHDVHILQLDLMLLVKKRG